MFSSCCDSPQGPLQSQTVPTSPATMICTNDSTPKSFAKVRDSMRDAQMPVPPASIETMPDHQDPLRIPVLIYGVFLAISAASTSCAIPTITMPHDSRDSSVSSPRSQAYV